MNLFEQRGFVFIHCFISTLTVGELAVRKMEFLEIVFWSVVILGGVFRVMGWVDWGEILEILGIIVQFRQGGGEGENGN